MAKIALIAGIAAVGAFTAGLGLLPGSVFGAAIGNGGPLAYLLGAGLGESDPRASVNLFFPKEDHGNPNQAP